MARSFRRRLLDGLVDHGLGASPSTRMPRRSLPSAKKPGLRSSVSAGALGGGLRRAASRCATRPAPARNPGIVLLTGLRSHGVLLWSKLNIEPPCARSRTARSGRRARPPRLQACVDGRSVDRRGKSSKRPTLRASRVSRPAHRAPARDAIRAGARNPCAVRRNTHLEAPTLSCAHAAEYRLVQGAHLLGRRAGRPRRSRPQQLPHGAGDAARRRHQSRTTASTA